MRGICSTHGGDGKLTQCLHSNRQLPVFMTTFWQWRL